MTDLARRIKSRTVVTPDGCWQWTGGKSEGYGRLSFDGVLYYTHRAMFEALVGPIPDGLTIDHLCRNRACCNPAHLEPVTRGENVRRGIAGAVTRARFAKARAARTHCKHGHDLAVVGTYTRTVQGYETKVCRECGRTWRRSA